LSIVVRPFREGDLERVSLIESSSFRDPWPRDYFIYLHKKTPDLFLVAIHGEEVVGYIVGEIVSSGVLRRYRRGHILNIAVDGRQRRRGVGTRLMREIESKFRERRATKASLEVRESNAAARSFYRRRGYEETGRVRGYYPDEDAVMMSKTLQAEPMPCLL